MTATDQPDPPPRPITSPATAAPPPFDIVGPGTRRMTVSPHRSSDTVRDLARALGESGDVGLLIDGSPAAPHEPLVRTNLRAGSTVSPHRGEHDAAPVRAGAGDADDGVAVVVATGPDCNRPRPLPPGRHVVGRASSCAVRIDDRSVEPHHGLIEVSSDGVATFLQLTGRIPATVDGAPCSGTTVMQPGAVLSIGRSGLVVGPRHPPSPSTSDGRLLSAPGDPWRRIVQRGCDAGVPDPPDPIPHPIGHVDDPMPPATGLVGAGVAVLGAGVVAVLLGQLLFALFALIGAMSSLATWAIAVVGTLRRRRTGRAAARSAQARFDAQVAVAREVARTNQIRANPTVTDVLDVLERTATAGAPTGLWQRRLTSGGAPMRVVLGCGDHPWTPPFDPDEDGRGRFGSADLRDVPVTIDLAAGSTIAIRGDDDVTAGIVRSLIVQLAAHHGPADWRLIVVSRSPGRWRWATWLPHAVADDGGAGVFSAEDGAGLASGLDGAHSRSAVLVVDAVDLFAMRTGPLRRYLDVAEPCAIALVGASEPVPAMCDVVVDVATTGSATVRGVNGVVGDGAGIAPSGISVATARDAARALTAMIDPEDECAVSASIAASLTLAEVDDIIDGVRGDDASRRAATNSVVNRWATAGDDPAPRAVIGRSADGAVEIDLVRDGPHALIAGTTGAGKSELLRTLVTALALRCSPDHLTFVLVDYKGGSTFDACADLPHTVGLVTDLDAGLAERALISLEAELHRRERLLRTAGATDLTHFRARPDQDVLPRLVVVIDEFAALARDLPDFLSALVGIAQRGRSLGLHLVLATQRPAGVVSDDIRANTNLRLALRLHDVTDAHDVVGDRAPAGFPRRLPGRAALRLGPDELVTFQTACCAAPAADGVGRLRVVPSESTSEPTSGSTSEPTSGSTSEPTSGSTSHSESVLASDAPTTGGVAAQLLGRGGSDASASQLDIAVAVVGAAVRAAGIEPPHRPWIAPLPEELTMADVGASGAGVNGVDVTGTGGDAAAIGLVDDPAAQCRRPLGRTWADGTLAVIGSLGSGTTSTLLALIAAACRAEDPDHLNCYVIDARGDERFGAVADVAHCGAVVRIGELERLHRLLARLVTQVEAGDGTAVVLVIDGLGSLRNALSSIEQAPTLALLDRVLGDGPVAGVVTWWCDDGVGSAPTSGAAETWRLRLDEPAASGIGGSGPAATVGDVAGRLRVASSGLTAQVACDAGDLSRLPPRSSGRGPAPVERLPALVPPSAVRSPAVCPDASSGALDLPLGLAASDLAVASLLVPEHDHVFIGGAASTGKSTALRQLGLAWSQRNPDGVRLAVDRRHPLTTDRLDAVAGGPVLALVDDGERVDDADGALAAIIAGVRLGVTIVVAARLDAVRASYGHWTRDVARSRCGVILTSAGEVDGDLLGVVLPRRNLIAPRPGLGWLVDIRGHRLVQLAHADLDGVRPDQGDAVSGGSGAASPSSQRGPSPRSLAVSAGL